ncbi:hypothetical protein VPH35_070714 [Triticum aestivum]
MAASDQNDMSLVRRTVQELAVAVEEPPPQYVVDEMLVADEMPEPIPLIDLSRLTEADEADKLRAVLQTWGLFLATNHGIEESLMDAMMSASMESRDFFMQPYEEKQKYSNLIDGKHFQMKGHGNDKVVTPQDEGLSWNDRLHLRVEPEDERNFAKWPTHPESFRDVLHEYASRTKRTRDLLLQSMAKLLDLDEDYFVNQISNKASGFARFNYYPPCPRPDLVLGRKPHTDGGLLTILFVDQDVGGLQVERGGKLYNVPAKPYTLVNNVADPTRLFGAAVFFFLTCIYLS